MSHKPMLLSVIVIGLAAPGAWSQTAQPPVVRLSKAGKTLQNQAALAEGQLKGLDAKIQTTKQTVPSVTRSLEWIGAAVSGKKIFQRLQKTKADLSSAQKGLSKFSGGCQGLTAADWEPVIAADKQLAQAVKGFKKIQADLTQLHNAKLGESALRPFAAQLNKTDPGQAQVLEAMIKTIQDALAGSAASLKKGVEAKDLAQAGSLLETHNAYCQAQPQPKPVVKAGNQTPIPPPIKMAAKVDNQEKAAENIELSQSIPMMSHSDHVPTPGDFKDVIKTMKGILPKSVKISEGSKAGGVASAGVLVVTAFLTPILANSGYQPAVAALISDEILNRMKGRGANIVYTSGKDQLFDNGHFEVVDRNNVIVGTIDKKTGFIIPANWVLDLYEPSNNFLGQNKDKQKVSQKPAYSSHSFTPPPLQPWLSSEWGPPPAYWDGPVLP